MTRLFLVIAIWFFTACAAPNAHQVANKAQVETTGLCCKGCINPNLGKSSEVRGILENTKLAPSIVAKDFRVYCLGATLAEGAIGKEVLATGRLEYTNEFAVSTVEENPHAQSQGTSGQDLVLRECTVRVLASD